jgi:hypothetical protein
MHTSAHFDAHKCTFTIHQRTTSQFVSVHHGRLVHSLARCRRGITGGGERERGREVGDQCVCARALSPLVAIRARARSVTLTLSRDIRVSLASVSVFSESLCVLLSVCTIPPSPPSQDSNAGRQQVYLVLGLLSALVSEPLQYSVKQSEAAVMNEESICTFLLEFFPMSEKCGRVAMNNIDFITTQESINTL